jgi:hypothetical protein
VAATKSDYYAVLHVSHDAPTEIIRASYQTLMQKLKRHPDLGGEATLAAVINEAYAVLSDAKRRAEYDAHCLVTSQILKGVPEKQFDDVPVVAPIRLRNPLLECVFCEARHGYGESVEKDAACRSCDSPLWPIKPQRFAATGKRAIERVYKTQAITYYTHARQVEGFAAHTKDISPNGLRFITPHELNEGQYVRIVSEVLDAVATVTNCTFERKGWQKLRLVGVAFVTLRFIRPLGGLVSRHV